jgi:peptidyl-dipeptidase Dcp
MSKSLFACALAAGLLVSLPADATQDPAQPMTTVNAKPKSQAAPSKDDTGTNPLLAPWTGNYGGVPAFDKVKVEHFEPALETAMAEQLKEVDAIAANPAAPTFDNTLAALERTGHTFDRVAAVYGVFSSTMNDEAFQQVERSMAPKLAAFGDKITQNVKLFERIAAVYDARETSNLTPEQKRLAWVHYTNFARSGAKLDAAAKTRLSQINQQLATLYTTFSQNVLADETDRFTLLTQESDLAGLPDSFRAGLAAAAEGRGEKGKWVVVNTRSSVEPFLTYSERRDLREKVWKTFVQRGDNGDAHDNNATIGEILKLRTERARLLGYRTHAHWRLENAMAKNPERAMELMEAVWTPAVARVHEEVADMQALANRTDKMGAKLVIEPWDYRYYAEKVRKEKYDLDENEVKPYLQLDKLREGMFWMAGQLFGFQFSPIGDVPVVMEDVKVWKVSNPKGELVGLWYFDPYARKGKRSGAWMNAYRTQERFDGEIKTIVSNNSNFVEGKAGEPVLVSWTDAKTMFHEFGHALHGLSSSVNYPTLAGTSVARDYVEFPSQLLEHWLPTAEILDKFALHYQTGKPIPKALVEKIDRAEKFNQGFATVEYLSSALIDMKLHLEATPDKAIDPDAFERDTLTKLGMPKEIVMRHRTPQFLHVFAGDGYSAGYYSYLWSDTITADAWEAFVEAGGAWSKPTAEKLVKNVFSVGNTIDPADGYRAFRGKDPEIGALMRKRGFPEPAKKSSK